MIFLITIHIVTLDVENKMNEPQIYIPIWYKRATLSSVKATFDTTESRKGASAVINGKADGDFGPIPDLGEYLTVEGATFELMEDDDGESWSGDMNTGRFSVTHDGKSAVIVVTYYSHDA